MKPTKSSQPVLGVMVTSRTVHAVLVRPESSGPVILHRFVRQRNARPISTPSHTPAMASLVPELQEDLSGSDFSIQFGDGGGSGSDLFLKSEFSGFQGAAGAVKTDAEAGDRAGNFMYELSEILEECRQAGYERPQVAFSIASAEVAHVELHVLSKQKKGGKPDGADKKEGNGKASARDAKPASRDQLLKLLHEQYKGDIDSDVVSFIPMTPAESGSLRYLAIVPKKNEPVAVTLQALRKQREERPPNTRLLDTEGTLFLGLARAALRKGPAVGHAADDEAAAPKGSPSKGRNTLLVRAGAEDTLLFFMDGERLRHFESMRSLTAFDSPDTICSRVLLQQDEYGVEEVHNVFLLSEDREEQLVESFRAFFPEANVTSIRAYLPELGEGAGLDTGTASFVSAYGVALRLVGGETYRHAFEDINLIPKRLARQKIDLPFTWHTFLLAAVLFGTALFFGSRYVLMEQKIDDYREQLRQYPPSLAEADPRALQARIDSMQALYNGYMRALSVLDTLLIGSDKWSRGLEELSRETAAVRGVWVDSWTPSTDAVTISGNATSRDRVVQLAERLQANIHSLTFSEIRDWPVYSFVMVVTLEEKLPEAARYLREHALSQEGAPGAIPTGPATAPGAQPAALQ